jgi:Family of unknown function (DUF6527)
MAKKLYQASGPNGLHEGYYYFECPGCKCEHYINTNPNIGAVWTFDGNFEAPTVSPSLLVTIPRRKGAPLVCHSFIRNGKIEFLSDCTHELAGQTVDMIDIEE